MRSFLSILLLLCAVTTSQGQSAGRHGHEMRITHIYNNVSLSEALRQLNVEDTSYEINFLYNELEDFRITTTVRRKTVPDAIRQMIGFYPIRMCVDSTEITVECLMKTALRYKGTVVDEAGRPIAYANVLLLSPSDSTVIGSGVSNEAGHFVVPSDLQPVVARISFVGYKTVYRHSTSSELGTIMMTPETQALKGVTVKGQTPILRREAGTFILDTRNIVGAIDATDLLRYAPGILLDDDNLMLFGTSGIVFCINGKEQHMGFKDIVQMLKSYPASDVEKIEITLAPEARYSAAGNAGVINLILRKKANDYVGGSVGYAHTHYRAHGDEANANVIYNKGNVSTSINISGTWNNTLYKETSAITLNDQTRANNDNGHISNDNYSARWQLDCNVSERLNVGAYAMISHGDRRLDVDGNYTFSIKDNLGSDIITTEARRSEATNTYALNANASHKLSDNGAMINCNLDYYHLKMGDDRKSDATSVLSSNLPYDFYYQNEISHTVSNYSAKADARVGGFKIGLQHAFTRSSRNLIFWWTPDYHQWSNFVYDEQVLSAYKEYSGKFGHRLSFNVGGRYEHTWTKECDSKGYGYEGSQHTRYARFFPSLRVVYQPAPDHSLNWSVSSRITRPNIISVNPDTLCNDAYHSTTGNPMLKPTYLYKAMMGYTYKGVLGFDLYYAYEPDRMTLVTCVGHRDNIFTMWNNNVDEQCLGINSSYYFDHLKWMNAILTQGIYWSRTTGDGLYTLPDMEGWSYTGELQTKFFFDRNRKWTANVDFTFSSKKKDVTRSYNARYLVDAGLQYRLWKEHLTISAVCSNLFASHIRGTVFLGTTVMDFDNTLHYRQLRLTLTYNWGARLRQNRRQYQSDEVRDRMVNDF